MFSNHFDIGVFQTYKYWHRKAVQHTVQSLDYDYIISSFFRDLNDIRMDTLKKVQFKALSERLESGQLMLKQILKK
jgi:hypothetical protein